MKPINGESITNFFEQIRTQYTSNSCRYIMLDGVSYHHSSPVVEKEKLLNYTIGCLIV